MRMVFGLAGLLVTLGVIVWIIGQFELPMAKTGMNAQDKVQQQVDQLSGRTNTGIPVEDTYKLKVETRTDGRVQSLKVVSLAPNSPMFLFFGLKADDVINSTVGDHGLQTNVAGLDPESARDAVRDSFAYSGELTVMRGNMQLTLPRDKNVQPPAPAGAPPIASNAGGSATKPAQSPQQPSASAAPAQPNQPNNPDNGQDPRLDNIQRRITLPGF